MGYAGMHISSTVELDDYQAEVLDLLFERTAIDDRIKLFRFVLSADRAEGSVVVVAPLAEQGAHVVLNLPARSPNVLVSLSYDDPRAVAALLAKLEDHERKRGFPLALGEMIITPGRSSHRASPYAVLLLPMHCCAELPDLPDTAEVADHNTAFMFAVPLTKAEYELRAEHGHDTLLNRFEVEGRRLSF